MARRPDLHSVVSNFVTTVLKSSQICCEDPVCCKSVQQTLMLCAQPDMEPSKGPAPCSLVQLGHTARKTPRREGRARTA